MSRPDRQPVCRPSQGVVASVLCLLALAGGLHAQPAAISDDRLDRALRRGREWLVGQVRKDGSVPSRCFRTLDGGAEAMVALALLESGAPAADAPLPALLGYLTSHPSGRTAARALRIELLGHLGRTDDLAAQALALAASQRYDGGWSTGPDDETSNVLDTAAALEAIGLVRRAGLDVPGNPLRRAAIFLERARNADGGFGYLPGRDRPVLRGTSHGSATAAVAAAQAQLLLLPGKNLPTNLRPPLRSRYRLTLQWLGRHLQLDSVPRWWWGDEPRWTWRWHLARAPRALHPGQLADRDLAEPLARVVLELQQPDGRWLGQPLAEDDLLATAQALRTLALLRQPLLLQVLSLRQDRPDVALAADALCRWIEKRFDTRGTWRVLPHDASADALRAAPLLLLAPADRLRSLPERLGEALRTYLVAGGWLIVQKPPRSPAGPHDLPPPLADLLPGATPILPNESDPLFSARFRSRPIPMAVLTRPGKGRVLLPGSDLLADWAHGPDERTRDAFGLLGNAALLATGGNWPTHRFAPPPKPSSGPMLRIGRVFHAGPWNLAPSASVFLSGDLLAAISTGVQEETVYLTKPIPEKVTLLWWIAENHPALDARDRQRLAAWVGPGRLLLVDFHAQGTVSQRRDALRKLQSLLAETFPDRTFQRVSRDEPLLQGSFAGGVGSNIATIRYLTSDGRQRSGEPRLWGLRTQGRWIVLFSAHPLAASIVGNEIGKGAGLTAADARRIILNCLLYAATDPETR